MAQRRLSEAAKKRLKAGRLLLAGKGCAEVALAVDVARQTVYTWKRLLDEGGIDALREVPERGRPAQLDEQQLAAVRAALLQGPTEQGFGTELWTLKRVGAVIERMHGVRFSQTQVWRILGSLGFSPQKPEKRAIERNEDAVRNWKRRTWPALKKSPARRPTDCLRGRVRHQRAPDPSPHLGAQGTNAHHPVSLQLESRLGHRWPHTHQLFVPAARGQHQEGRDRRIPQSAQGPLEAAVAGDLGRPEGASQSFGARVPGQPGWPHPDRVPATVRAGHEPGRIPVGVAEAPRACQLLPQRSRRAAPQRPQQAQERSKATFDHRRLLDAGYAVVMS
jgi:transposase